ncbi:hypothetical protein ACFV30_35460 [Streptomyces sp. NPDC059752]|uniref:hypothetical protein n=1 Tax=unclassified Streptomyces TaxID=2593676 RepID=UPI00364A1232
MQQTPLFAAHKGACDRAIDTWLERHYPEDEWLLMREELGHVLKQINYNAEHAFADDRRGEYHKAILKMPGADLLSETPSVDPTP